MLLKRFQLILILLLLLLWQRNNLPMIADAAKPSPFRDTLPRILHEQFAHCDHLADGPQTILCEILTAFNAQGGQSNLTSINCLPQSNSTCRYRTDEGHRMHRYATPPSAIAEKVFDAYLSMHRRCAAIDFPTLSETYNSGRIPHCRYVIWGAVGNGLGNRVISLVSAFLYAVLTQRVFLINYPPWNRLFCEPFGGIPAQIELDRSKAVRYLSFLDAGCNDMGGAPPLNPRVCEKVTIVSVDVVHHTNKTEMEFAICRSGIHRLRDVAFVMFPVSNQYFLPAFYLNPDFESLLDVLFPDRNPFHVISRLLMVPSDEVWQRIRPYADSVISGATRRIGAQIREYKMGEYRDSYDPNVLLCVRRMAGFAPTRLQKRRVLPRSDYFSVYVASLNARHASVLNESLEAVRQETGKDFKVTWQEVDGAEKHDVEHQQEALVDMWLLSLSDVLMTSRTSTFGYVAGALGNVVSYFLDHGDRAKDVCEVGATSDPCYHFPPAELKCEGGVVVAGLVNASSMVRPCVDLRGAGVQIVMESES